MKNNISRRDWRMLSAYLDGQLSSGEYARFETKLDKNPELKAALDEMREIQTLLRQIPAKRAPRNFTLTPQMVGVRRSPPRIFPALRFASAISTVLFILVWFSNFLLPTRFESQPPMIAMSEKPEPALEVVEPPYEPEPDTLVEGIAGEEPTSAPPGILMMPEENAVDDEDLDAQIERMALPSEIPTEIAESRVGVEGETDDQNGDEGEIEVLSIRENILNRITQGNIPEYAMAFLAFVAVSTGIAAIFVHRKRDKWT
ncbi:MAG: anti-sigma factor family protein [Anaerolineales bacterium]